MGFHLAESVVVLLSLISVVTAIECNHCAHVDFVGKSSHPNMLYNEYCQDFKAGKSVSSQTCPDESDVCQKIDGTYTFDHPTDGSVDVKATIRRCIKNNEKFDNDGLCIKGKDADADAHKLDIYPGDTMGDLMKFEGDICTCTGDKCNGAGQIRITVFLVTLFVVLTAILSA